MSLEDGRLQALQAVYPSALTVRDGPYELIHFPKLAIQVGGEELKLEALLCPQAHKGYVTRLFLSQSLRSFPSVRAKTANWTSEPFLGRQWHTWSWQGVSADQPLLSMLAAHLRALQ